MGRSHDFCINIFNVSLALELEMFTDEMGHFKESCLKNCYKFLKFVNFENRGTAIQQDILRAMRKLMLTSSLLLANNRSAYF